MNEHHYGQIHFYLIVILTLLSVFLLQRKNKIQLIAKINLIIGFIFILLNGLNAMFDFCLIERHWRNVYHDMCFLTEITGIIFAILTITLIINLYKNGKI